MSKRSHKTGRPIPPGPSPNPDDALLNRIRAAVVQPSRSDEDAQVFLDGLDNSAPLPPLLSDPSAAVALILGGDLPEIRGRHDLDGDYVHSLRRAARNGQEISLEVEEAMRRAREAAVDEKPNSEGS